MINCLIVFGSKRMNRKSIKPFSAKYSSWIYFFSLDRLISSRISNKLWSNFQHVANLTANFLCSFPAVLGTKYFLFRTQICYQQEILFSNISALSLSHFPTLSTFHASNAGRTCASLNENRIFVLCILSRSTVFGVWTWKAWSREFRSFDTRWK